MRSPEIPSSPPKNATIIIEQAAINSPTPSEIIANRVPAPLVEKAPMSIAKPIPNNPPNRGSKGKGKGKPKSST